MSSALTFSVRSPKDTSVPGRAREASATTSLDRKAALLEDVQHFAAHIARGADDRNLETHKLLLSLSARFLEKTRRPMRVSTPGPDPGEGGQAKGIRPFWWSFWPWFWWNGGTRRRARHNGSHCGQGSRMQKAPSTGRASNDDPVRCGLLRGLHKESIGGACTVFMPPCTMAAAGSTNGQDCLAGMRRHVLHGERRP